MTAHTVLTDGLEFPEGPSFDTDGNLYVTEIRGGQVSRIDPSGVRTLFARTGGGPNGSAFGFDQHLYVCNNGGLNWTPEGRPNGLTAENKGGWVERVAPDGTVEVLYTHYEGEPLQAPNDIVFDETGGFYFTDSRVGTREARPPGEVYWATPDGGTIRRVSEGYRLANGIGITADGATLVVAESITRRLWACDIVGPGEVAERREFGVLPEPFVPDGFCFDAEGNLICAAINGGGLISFDDEGTLVERIELEDPDVTNVAFGGPELDVLYATEGNLGRVVKVPWPSPGMRLFPDRR